MRKIRLRASIANEKSRRLLDDIRFIRDCLQAVDMFVRDPGPDVDDAIRKALEEAQKQLDVVKGYMGMTKVNSAKLQVGGQRNDVDSEFMEEVDSILGLDDGQSIDISKARLLYNEDTMELMLTDEEETPEGFELVGTVEEAADTDDAADNDGEELVHEESAENADGEPEGAEPAESEPERPEEPEKPQRKEPEF